MSAIGPGLQTFALAVDKGFDYIPEKAFATPQGRQKREQQRQQQREEELQQQQRAQEEDDDGEPQRRRSSEQSKSAPRPATAAYQQPPRISPPPNYTQDPYAQDRGFARSGRQAFSPTSGRTDEFDPRDSALTQKRGGMQNDSYYQPPYGDQRRSYNPSDYQPREGGDDNRVGYRRDNASYGESYAGRAASAGPRSDRYSGRYSDEEDDYRDDRRDRKHRHHHDSRSSSEEGIRGKIGGRFDKTQHGLATGALGALAGGVLAHEIGGKNKGVWPTVAGVVIGGLGANALEARHEKKKHARDEDHRRTRSVDGGKHAFKSSYEDDYDEYQERRNSRRGGDRGDRDYDDGRSSYDNRYDRYER